MKSKICVDGHIRGDRYIRPKPDVPKIKNPMTQYSVPEDPINKKQMTD